MAENRVCLIIPLSSLPAQFLDHNMEKGTPKCQHTFRLKGLDTGKQEKVAKHQKEESPKKNNSNVKEVFTEY